MRVVGVGQRGAGHATVKTHMVEFAAQRSQARFDIAKSTSISEMGKSHRQILIPTGEAARSCVSAVPSDASAKLAIRQETQQLGEYRAALVHEPLSAAAKMELRTSRRSNRGKAKSLASHWRSKPYRNSQSTLPDTSEVEGLHSTLRRLSFPIQVSSSGRGSEALRYRQFRTRMALPR